MENAYSLALVGFLPAEAATLESFFRLAARRAPAYAVQDEVMDAQALIVNADNADALRLVREAALPAKVLLVGYSDGGTGWPLQNKPVKLVGVLNALDKLMGFSRGSDKAATPAPRPAASKPPAFAPTQPFTRSQFQALNDSMRPANPAKAPPPALSAQPGADRVPRRDFALTEPMSVDQLPGGRHLQAVQQDDEPSDMMSMSGLMGLDDAPALRPLDRSGPPSSGLGRLTRPPVKSARLAGVQRGDVLIISENLAEGRVLHQRLGRYGLRADWSRQGSQALVMLKAHHYRLVIVERVTGQPDAFSLCRTAKGRKTTAGDAPVVFLMSGNGGGMDRIKAGLAGCDAFLPRAVDEADFYRALTRNNVLEEEGFETTGGVL
ncbi:hypothetical protein [Hydrogenophaga sp. 5NK40-0174]|uniref:hypothetical protein n=1 Tax=Hydrogenophaga sp. 5NK40-0174 TaxID=3127649 RepID=UPI0031026A17